MKLSFAWKLGIVTTLLSVGLTSMGVYFYYSMTHRMLMEQMGETLKNVGRVGLFLFDHESREAIKRLKLAAKQGLQVNESELAAIPVGGTMNSLSAADIARLEASPDFLLVRKKLRMIAAASYSQLALITEKAEMFQDDYQLNTRR